MEQKNYKPSISSAFSGGMQLFKKAAGGMIGYWFILLIMIFAVFGIIMGVSSVSLNNLSQDLSKSSMMMGTGASFTIIIVVVVIEVLVLGLWLGYHLYMDGVYKKGNEEFGMFFKGIKYTPNVILAYILRFLIMLPLLAVPYYFMFQAQTEYMQEMQNGVFSSTSPAGLFGKPGYSVSYVFMMIVQLSSWVFFQFTTELVVLGKKSAVEAIKLSVITTKKHFGFFLGLLILLGLINFVGYFCVGLGLIFTIPFSMCIIHVLYQKLFVTDELGESIEEFGDSQEEFVELDSL